MDERTTGRRRTLEQRAARDTSASSVDGARPWTTGVLGAVQALVFSLAAVVVPVIAMTVAADAQVDGSTSGWTGSVPVAVQVWLLGHGVPLHTESAVLTIVPLGVSVVAVFGAFVSARRSILPAVSAAVAAVVTTAAGVLLLTVLTGPVTAARVGAALLGGAAVSILGTTWGVLGRPDAGPLVARVRATVARVPVLVRLGLRGAAVTSAATVATAGVVTLVWLLVGRGTMSDVVQALSLDAASAVSFAVAQLALLPNLVVWALTWTAGPGFAVGSGTHFGVDQVSSGPLPAIPLLGALPGPDATGGALLWLPALVVAAGALGAWCLHRRLERIAWWHVLVLAALVGAGSGVLTAALVALASGAGGPGRLADVGASAAFLGGAVAALTALGALVLLLVVRPEVREGLVTLWRAARTRLGRGTTAPSQSGTSPARGGLPAPTASGSIPVGRVRRPGGAGVPPPPPPPAVSDPASPGTP